MNFPPSLWKRLYYKLHEQVFDAGAVFGLRENDLDLDAHDKEDAAASPAADPKPSQKSTIPVPTDILAAARAPYTAVVTAEDAVPAAADCWLIDHAWTTTPARARQQLIDNPGVWPRVGVLVGVLCVDGGVWDVEEEEEDVGDDDVFPGPHSVAVPHGRPDGSAGGVHPR